MPTRLTPAFNSGEFSPLVDGRVDLARYATSVRRMENAQPAILGFFRKRAGLEFAYNLDGWVRLERFIFSQDENYLLGFGVRSLIVWDGVSFQTFEAEWEDPQSLRMVGVNNWVLVTGPDIPLTRLVRGEWTPTPVPLEGYPFLDTPANAGTWTFTDPDLITAPPGTFTEEWEGQVINFPATQPRQQFSIDQKLSRAGNKGAWDPDRSYAEGDKVWVKDDADPESEIFYTCILDYPASTSTAEVPPAPYFSLGVYGVPEPPVRTGSAWSVQTSGRWHGQWLIQRSYDAVEWETLYTLESANDSNYQREGDESAEPAYIRLVMVRSRQNDKDDLQLIFDEWKETIPLTIVEFIDDTQVRIEGDPLPPDGATTDEWQVAAWGPATGYPQGICMLGNRLILGGTRDRPQTIWGSRVDQWFFFERRVVEDDEPFEDTLFSGRQTPIHWLRSHGEDIHAATEDSMWILRGENRILGPGRNYAVRQEGTGSANVDSVEAGAITFYAQFGGLKVRSMVSDVETRGTYLANDVSIFAEHLLRPVVRHLSFQPNREDTLWVVLEDGSCVACTYDYQEGVMGWWRMAPAGVNVISVASLPTDGDEDEVWFCTEKDGSYCLEVMRPGYNSAVTADRAGWRYLDHYSELPAGTETITDLDPGETYQVVSGGALVANEFGVVDWEANEGGVIALDEPLSADGYVGQPYEMQVQMNRPEVNDDQGTAQGRELRISCVNTDIYKTAGLEYSEFPDGDVMRVETTYDLQAEPQLFTGMAEVETDFGHSTDASFTLRHRTPQPCIVRRVATRYTLTGRG